MSIVLKAKTEKKLVDPQKSFFFEFWNKNRKPIFSSYFSFALALKTIDAQMLFDQFFVKVHKKTLLTAKNGQDGVFDSQ